MPAEAIPPVLLELANKLDLEVGGFALILLASTVRLTQMDLLQVVFVYSKLLYLQLLLNTLHFLLSPRYFALLQALDLLKDLLVVSWVAPLKDTSSNSSEFLDFLILLQNTIFFLLHIP